MNTISSRASEITLPTGGRAVIVPANVKDVVSITGSILAGPSAYPHGLSAAAAVAGNMLDAGAGKLGKQAFRDALAARGADVSFGTDGTRLTFGASCFPEDTKFVIERIADALLSPHLAAAEFAPEKSRMLTDLADEASDTRTQADHAITRLLYGGSVHPHFIPTFASQRALLEKATLAEVRKTAQGYGTEHLALTIVGDVSVNSARAAIERAFAKAGKGLLRPAVSAAKSASAKRDDIAIKDKANADVVMGARLGFNTDDARYLPTALVVHALGGSFASHLMQTVRERDGLTYGVRSSLKGFDDKLDGYLRIWGTFAPALFVHGIDTLRKETALFLNEKVTEELLANIKEEIIGSYAVSLSTTASLASRINRFLEDDRPLSRVDEYPALVNSITIQEAKDAAAYLASLPLSIATAGSV